MTTTYTITGLAGQNMSNGMWIERQTLVAAERAAKLMAEAGYRDVAISGPERADAHDDLGFGFGNGVGI